jgi:general stress protein YciG
MPNDNSKRGFGSMDDEKQREISSKGGKASHGGQSGSDSSSQSRSAGSRGGSHEQHVKAGQQSHKNS